MSGQSVSRRRAGFTLSECALALVIMGVLAAFGVPRFNQGVERSKAAEAFAYGASVRSAQDRYRSHHQTYANTLADLDIAFTAPRFFAVGPVRPGSSGSIEDSWSLTLTRTGDSAGYGSYTIVYTQAGFDGVASTLDALPDIDPLVTSGAGTGGAGR
jgi:prepilin-type N-terminal cleavage/methylation domain-containing protein